MAKRWAKATSFLGAIMLLATTLIPGPIYSAGTAAPLEQGTSRTFPETGKTVKGRFLEYWTQNGGLAQQGYPISEEMQEKSDTDGKTYTIQYFERAVFELHRENSRPYDVLLSLLGVFQYKQKYPSASGAPGQKPNNAAGSVLYQQTGKRLGGRFQQYWSENGGLTQQGYPISDEFAERSDLDGKTYTVQYFERSVFEYHPENKPPYDVLLSQLGTFRYKAKHAAAGKPNIVFVLADDLDVAEIAFMPKLKSLIADQGTTFSQFFVTDSLCCPSRASILRGQYVHNHGVLSNGGDNGGFEQFHKSGDEDSTIGTWLKGAGYRTALMGKYLNGYPSTVVERAYVPPGWDEWDGPVTNTAYGEFNYVMNENGKLVTYGSKSEDYLIDVMAKKSEAFIGQASKDNVPFFMYLATYAPHQPATPAPRHANLFPDAKAPRTSSFNEADVSDKPDYIQSLPLLTNAQIQEIDDLYRKRLQSLQAVDEMIGGLVDTLKTTGELDNTYIVFTSDNGFHLGQHRMMMGKQTAYETDIHVPMIVRGPGVADGRTLDNLAVEVDFAPTFAQLAGATIPGFVDGHSLVPLFTTNPAPATDWRTGVLVEHYSGSDEPFQSSFEVMQQAGRNVIPTYQALRTKDYTYVEYAMGERELYDLRSDPEQLQNIYSKADASLLQQLAGQLETLRNCAGVNCQVADSEQ